MFALSRRGGGVWEQRWSVCLQSAALFQLQGVIYRAETHKLQNGGRRGLSDSILALAAGSHREERNGISAQQH